METRETRAFSRSGVLPPGAGEKSSPPVGPKPRAGRSMARGEGAGQSLRGCRAGRAPSPWLSSRRASHRRGRGHGRPLAEGSGARCVWRPGGRVGFGCGFCLSSRRRCCCCCRRRRCCPLTPPGCSVAHARLSALLLLPPPAARG
ncbi:calmodulin-3 isoform X1 [Sphaerodactylus townsendi]|uniref:calmodulin-3 isoform X1 n=1 Tax=Sphaerodactylus townsendi TaxID=933632 RepID=UPI00202761AD|nr:calmodulin-3 isoform X1 [Sphaerodactylus townsendi]